MLDCSAAHSCAASKRQLSSRKISLRMWSAPMLVRIGVASAVRQWHSARDWVRPPLPPPTTSTALGVTWTHSMRVSSLLCRPRAEWPQLKLLASRCKVATSTSFVSAVRAGAPGKRGAQYVEEDVDDVEIQVQRRENIVVDGELILVA